MQVRQLALSDFRNYHEADVVLEPGPNLFVGRNGQGKTNLVESLGYLSTLGSHRVSNDQALIRVGCDSAVIRTRLRSDERELRAEMQINRFSPNRAQINRGGIKPRELPRFFSSVLFAPEDLLLVRGDPSARRRFFDQLVVLLSPRMSAVQSDYERVLRQRNSLLKSARASGVGDSSKLGTLDIWDERLISLGSDIMRSRLAVVEQLSEPVRRAYEEIAGTDQRPMLRSRLSIDGAIDDDGEPTQERGTSFSSVTGDGIADTFAAALVTVRHRELDRGISLIGPHRDDVQFELNKLPARSYASHGESWSFALALKLGAAELLRRTSPLGDPVLMLDDVFAELDTRRRAQLGSLIADYEQVLITAAVFDDVPEALVTHTVRIEAGRIVEPTVTPPSLERGESENG
ncbi:DNA replication/repair protein RecF [Rathayibacter toxicus]|uniref:DNA replication/repair protein RecF n=1 Tax=Rathayibacter toxicus TaxID=145458 RepID=UPI001C05B68D|nr:DNA replication/repair protein RecF [Rathayibacter toxicus]QWL31402.1 DNA replication/repair protein RecF [Rathayibacter toxicus]QWL33492.1 DNA replication/repair protein RecF [Rathayibacter toxicus]QWL35627.1 DNA replication/repair protein RecF [Rathayibacter toxicus]QWL37716.1 DNA replication/repair protein RecF [Rathayibacter toxicus]QWL39806.1 DNA replication/repair protein RecF [Rathayibacter toxicus]